MSTIDDHIEMRYFDRRFFDEHFVPFPKGGSSSVSFTELFARSDESRAQEK